MSVGVIRPLCGILVAALWWALLAGAPAQAQTSVKVSLDGRIDGPSAPYLLGQDRGFYKAEGLDVTIDAAASSAESLTRVATGAYDLAVVDLNTLVRWRDQNANPPVRAVFVVYNRAPYAVIGRKSRGVASLEDLGGEKRLGAPPLEPASAVWPVLAKLNGINTSKMQIVHIGIPVREPMLAAGELDAVTGVIFGAPINLREKGVPADDITVLPMAEYGLDLYGGAVVVNPKFAADKGDAVKGFLRALARGLKETARDPAVAVDAVVQRNGGLSRDIELERLNIALNGYMVTPEVRERGLGAIDADRFDKAVEQLGLVTPLKYKPKVLEIFDETFLPPDADRVLD